MRIKGDIEEIRFRNEENGFTIAILDVGGDPEVVTGVFPPVVEGQTVICDGAYVIHKKYGRQFKATSCTVEAPDGPDGMIRYLGSGVIKGVGPVTAAKIVSAFGKDTFTVMEFNPSRLASIRGISHAKALEIGKEYALVKATQEIIMALQRYDIPLGTALKLYKAYGDETLDVVRSNPYRLIEDVDGIGFLTADKIASAVGIEKNSEFRISAGVVFVLKESVRLAGNTCYPTEKTIAEASSLLGVEEETVRDVIENMVIDRRIKPVEKNGERLFALPSVYRSEKNCAVLLARLTASADRIVYDATDDIAKYERINGISLHETQAKAVKSVMCEGVSLITGGPGTGKTTIIKCIVSTLDAMGKTVQLMAPTGRAAKRMTEATGRDARTIHRACRIGKDRGGDDGEKLMCDVIIVDEFSMVDIFLFESLLKRMSDGTKLVLVGDKDQLPSVGAGNVLADIISSGEINSVHLTHIYRQAKESLIVVNAHAVNRGEMPVLDCKEKDFFYATASEPEHIAAKAVDMVERIARFVGSEPKRVQVLCPMKNGAAGAIAINKLLQARLNGDAEGERLADGDYYYRKGDKVMHVVNNYELEWKIAVGYTYREGSGVYNGDIGTIREINTARGDMTVEFEDGRVAVYTPDIYNQLVLAYAITVHKSQGSEFDAVVVPITAGGPMMMTRNLLYTAITRAKKAVVLIGEQRRIKYMVDNDYVATRYSLLSELLREAVKAERVLIGGKI